MVASGGKTKGTMRTVFAAIAGKYSHRWSQV